MIATNLPLILLMLRRAIIARRIRAAIAYRAEQYRLGVLKAKAVRRTMVDREWQRRAARNWGVSI